MHYLDNGDSPCRGIPNCRRENPRETLTENRSGMGALRPALRCSQHLHERHNDSKFNRERDRWAIGSCVQREAISPYISQNSKQGGRAVQHVVPIAKMAGNHFKIETTAAEISSKF